MTMEQRSSMMNAYMNPLHYMLSLCHEVLDVSIGHDGFVQCLPSLLVSGLTGPHSVGQETGNPVWLVLTVAGSKDTSHICC